MVGEVTKTSPEAQAAAVPKARLAVSKTRAEAIATQTTPNHRSDRSSGPNARPHVQPSQ